MAWTAEITAVVKRDNETLNYTVSYTDGKETRVEEMQVRNPDLKVVKQAIKARIDKFEQIDTVLAMPPIGPVDFTEDPPSQVEQDKQKFLDDYAALKAWTVAIQAKLKDATDPIYTALATTVKNEFAGHEDEYLPLIGGTFMGF